MARSLAAALVLALSVPSLLAAPPNDPVRVELTERSIPPGAHEVVLSVYETATAETPLASETRTVRFDRSGSFLTTLGALASATGGSDGRWIGVRVPPGPESRRVPLAARTPGGVTVHVVTDAAITANGIIESIAQGFRFPDGSIQTSAAQVSGGVPSVNGIGSAVTIAGAGTASVGTAGGTITITGAGLTGVTAGNGLSGGGSSGSPTLNASYGSPVTIGTSNADGSATTLARADHVHAHGNQAGGTLHANATTSTAGFLSATDKTKLDATLAYARTVLVSPVGTDAANGTALINALAAISSPSSTNPWLLRIEPGTYDVGSSGLTMRSFVDIEGSGEGITILKATRGNSSATSAAAAIVGAANTELRNLTVTNVATLSHGIGYFASGSGGTMRIRNVTINSSGGTTNSYGVFAQSSAVVSVYHATITATAGATGSPAATGFHASTSTTNLQNCTITAKGVSGSGTLIAFNMASSAATATIDSSSIIATGNATQNFAIEAQPGTATVTNTLLRADTAASRTAAATSASTFSVLKIMHSIVTADSGGLNSSHFAVSEGANSTIVIGTSQVDGSSSGSPKCVHVYDLDMDDLNNTCPGPIG